jgi:hypothetical membrane protein
MKSRTFENWLCLSGVAACVFYFMHVFIGAANYPGYDWVKQAVSDLTAEGSASYMVATRYTTLYGTFS